MAVKIKGIDEISVLFPGTDVNIFIDRGGNTVINVDNISVRVKLP